MRKRSENTTNRADQCADRRREAKTVGSDAPNELQEQHLPTTSQTRAAAPASHEQTIPRELEAVIAGEYENRGTIRSISEHHRIAGQVIRDFLAQRGVLRKPGDHLKKNRPAAATEEIEPSELPPPPTLAKKARAGKPRTTLLLDETMLSEVSTMIAKGEGGGLVAIAKAKHLNIKELSAALKARGVVLRNGKKNVMTSVTLAPGSQAQGQSAKRSPAKTKDRLMMPSLFDQAF